MKKLLCALLAAMMIFCTGCSSAAAAQNPKETGPLPEAESVGEAGSYDLTEGETVDDSMTFRWARRLEDKTLARKLQEEILPEYVDTWFENGEILDLELQDNVSGSATGWVLIGGKTKQDMGWNSLERQGKTAYCRRIQVTHVPHSQDYHLEKTLAAPDLRYPESLVNPDILLHESIEDTGLILPKIRSAELYVRSLGKVFILQDPERLSVLQKAATLPPQVRKWTFRAGLPVDGVGNPLILDLEGQRNTRFPWPSRSRTRGSPSPSGSSLARKVISRSSGGVTSTSVG